MLRGGGPGHARDSARTLGHGGGHALIVSVELGIRNHVALWRQESPDPGDCDVLRVGVRFGLNLWNRHPDFGTARKRLNREAAADQFVEDRTISLTARLWLHDHAYGPGRANPIARANDRRNHGTPTSDRPKPA